MVHIVNQRFQNMGCLDLQGIKIISIYMFLFNASGS